MKSLPIIDCDRSSLTGFYGLQRMVDMIALRLVW